MKAAVLLALASSCFAQVQLERVLSYRQSHPLSLDAALQESQILLTMQRPIDAKQVLDEACDIDPKAINCLALKSEVCRKLNQTDEAKALLERCTKLAPSNPETWKWLGDFELGRKDPAALECFRKATALAPKDAQAWAGLAVAQDQAGQSSDASFAKAIALNTPPNAVINLLYGDHLRESGDSKAAILQYNCALSTDKTLTAAQLGRAHAEFDLKNFAAAETDLEACQKDPKLKLEALNLLYKVERAAGDQAAAQRCSQQIEALSSEKMKRDAAANDVASNLARAAELLRKNQAAEAAKIYSELVHQHPEAAIAYEGIARAQAQAGDYKDAEHSIAAFLKTAPQNAVAHSLYGRILLAQHRPSNAAPEFTKAIQLDPLLIEARLGLAASQIAANNYQAAISSLKQTVQLPSAGVPARLMLTEALYKDHQRAAALDELNTLLMSDAHNQEALRMKHAIETDSSR